MSKGRPCRICTSPEYTRIVAEMDAENALGISIVHRLQELCKASGEKPIDRWAVATHRRSHLGRSAIVLAEAEIEKRDKAVAEATADSDEFIRKPTIVRDLRLTCQRLERMAAAAEAEGSPHQVGQLSSVQLRAVEARARLGEVGGFGRPAIGSGEGVPFSITINLGPKPIVIEAIAERVDGSESSTGSREVVSLAPLPAPDPEEIEVT